MRRTWKVPATLASSPGLSICAVLLGASIAVSAADEGEDDDEAEQELPEMAFLEYLGMWDESDEDWLLLDDTGNDNEERSDPAPKGEASTETEDES